MIQKKPLRLYTTFWGEKHLALFEKALVRSLSWPLNKEALQGATWDIWTKAEDFPAVVDIAKAVGIRIELNEADSFLNDLGSKYLNDTGVMALQMFLISMRRCLSNNAQMLIAPPDTIFGGDSIANILQEGEQANSVVFVVHIRVHPSILEDIERQANRFGSPSSIGNATLVSVAMKNAHKSFTEGEFGKERINAQIGGIFWKKRPNGIFRVTHRLPTPYLINWTDDDCRYFSRQNPPGTWPPVFGEIDHLWPAERVFNCERARVLGSSDDAFIVEITEPEANVPALMKYDEAEPDKFWRGALHNCILRQFCVSFREEGA